ncbi:MAG TPA: hypothetical protein VIL74_24590 [Pyrinomonadaceae bacterium]|jgi:hypothetical protein
MKNIRFSLLFPLFILGIAVAANAQSAVSTFAGNWQLDKEKTYTAKDFPQKLKNYKMSVSGVEDAFNVKSQIDGTVEIETAGTGDITPVTQSASRVNNSQMQTPTTSTVGTGKINYGGTMAAFFTVNNATYNLNGEEVKIETKQGLVRVKAKADKSGKSLQFTTIRRMKTQNGEMEITTRETWKLAEDGKSLRLQRTVETPSARDEIVMILSKVG